jgi:hypothetical protein
MVVVQGARKTLRVARLGLLRIARPRGSGALTATLLAQTDSPDDSDRDVTLSC